jgi:rare lipoprotein A
MKKFIALSSLTSLLLVASPASAMNFDDIQEDYIYYNSIETLTEKKCINGYEDNTFRPDQKVNRAEAIKIILTCLDLPNIYTEQTFTVPNGTKVIVGNNESEVESETEVKFKIPFNADNYGDLSFKDIQADDWYVPFLKEAVVRKVITGYNDNTIRPFQSVNKAELYTILYRLTPAELKEVKAEEALSDDIASGYWYYDPLQFALENQLLTTNEEKLVTPLKELTRANVAHFVYEYSNWLNERIVDEESQTTTEEATTETETNDNSQETSEDTTNEEKTDETNNQEDSSSQSETNDTSSEEESFTESGVASYYGHSFDGRRTASGQILDVEANMAAHKTLPFGTIVRVTNPETEKWVEVTIFDRGPFVEGRIIDLTPSSFEALAPLSSGLVKVELEVISLPE